MAIEAEGGRSMVDPLVQRLLERAINSPVKLQLLLMFHEHPRMEATPASVAERTCRDIWSVTEALQDLADAGVMLHCRGGHGDPVYRYAPRAELIESIQRLLLGYDDPLERDTLQRSIRDLASYAPYRRVASWESQPA
jgi:hypothetical protein